MLRATQSMLLSAACLASVPAIAGETTLAEATQTQLGELSVTTYAFPTPRGLRVVATAQTGGAQPSVMRYEATLLPGQDTIVSVPQADGMPAEALRITRVGDRVSIDRVGSITE